MCRKIESVTIFRIIKSIDNNALVTQANVNGVYGKGFDEMKIKLTDDYRPSSEEVEQFRLNHEQQEVNTKKI